jgi:branched-chain amino acid transport system permease protein
MAADSYAERRVTHRRRPSEYVVPVLGLVLVGLILAWLGYNLYLAPEQFFRVFLIGITNGALYALVALGYTLVYGILELINFANGEVFMLGGMIAASLIGTAGFLFIPGFDLAQWGTPGATLGALVPAILVCLAVSIVVCGLINASIERVAYKPLRNAPRLAPLITAIGMSFILQNVAIVWKGTETVSVNQTLPTTEVFSIGDVRYTWDRFFVLLITIPVLVLLVWLVQYTRQGKAMRATAQDKDAASMMGIDVNRTISFTFLIAGGLAGAAGVIFAFYYTTVRFDTGFTLGLIAFTAAVLGGIGNLPGAVLGAMLIGLLQAFNEGLSWNAPGPAWTTSIVFGILIVILVFRPQGLLGERTPEGG